MDRMFYDATLFQSAVYVKDLQILRASGIVCVIRPLSLIIMYTAVQVQPLWNCCRKLSEIRATRRLLWHSDFTNVNFGRGSAAPHSAGGV